jgi:membrane protease YdiL (CAAX protease family)
VTFAGFTWLVFVASLGAETADWVLPGVLTAAGGVALMGSLAWLAERGIRARRALPEERYRGPSIILLFVVAVVAGTLLSLPPLLIDALAGREVTEPSTAALVVLLLVTPISFGAVGALFVLRPRALAGVRLGDGPATVRNITRGVAIGVVAWVVANGLGGLLVWLVTEVTGEAPSDSQLVADLAAVLPPLAAIALVGILAPVAEEFFFRWITVNAWEREHGTRVAIVGSAILFGAAHLLGGSILALPSIFLLGLILAAAYVWARSLPLVVGIHATFNCLSLAVIFLLPS